MTLREGHPAIGRLRVAIIDGRPLFRLGVVHALRSCREIGKVVEGATAPEALRLAEASEIDIVIIDLEAPGGGSDVVATIGRFWPAVRIVVVTDSERPEDVAGAFGCGARAYLLETAGADEFVNAVQRVATGETYLAPSLGARLLARPTASATAAAPKSPAATLTRREDEILAHVSVGATNKEIARQLRISEKTVKYFMTNIMQKLQVRNRVEAVLAARKLAAG